MSPEFTLDKVELFERDVAMRLPFRFGDTTVTEAAEAHVAITLTGPSGTQRGQSAQLMVPRWFDKNPDLTNADTVDTLRETLRHAARAASGRTGTVYQISAAIRAATRASLPASVPDLAAGFGPAVIEMALIDAACHGAGLSFPEAARADLFGLAGAAPDGLAAGDIVQSLANLAPATSIAIRHTVGYDSPLTADEVTDRPDDAPVALSEVIEQTGVTDFKIKLKGDPDADCARLQAIAAVLAPLPAFRATLDANEQYDPAKFDRFLAQFRAAPALDRLRKATLFVEQPFPREVALADDGPRPPTDIAIVIDESDDHDGAFRTALQRGWAGTSVKSCKGVLRALLNKAHVDAAVRAGRSAMLSAEDLTCQPGLCWQQDTLMAATIGATHVERNGHFFAGGMQGAGDREIAAAIASHPTLYRATPDGPRLRIDGGRVDISTLHSVGFASPVRPDLTDDRPLHF